MRYSSALVAREEAEFFDTDARGGHAENASDSAPVSYADSRVIYKRSIRAYEISIQLYRLAYGTPFDCGVLLPSRNSGGKHFLNNSAVEQYDGCSRYERDYIGCRRG